MIRGLVEAKFGLGLVWVEDRTLALSLKAILGRLRNGG